MRTGISTDVVTPLGDIHPPLAETIDGEMTTDAVTTDVGTTVTTTALVSEWTEAAAETETPPLTRMVVIDDMTTAAEIIDE